MAKLTGGHSDNTNDEWQTPAIYIEAARRAMGRISVDPASNDEANGQVKAELYFTKNDSGLGHYWYGNVWMNPPYSRALIKQFTDKLVGEIECGRVKQAITVTNNGTDTQWFHKMASKASAICFVKGRIAFENSDGVPQGNNNKGQVFMYFGDNPQSFTKEFKEFGPVALL